MLISYNGLVDLVKDGVIRNVDLANINGSSIDIRLGPDLLIEEPPPRWSSQRIALWKKNEGVLYREASCKEPYWIQRGQFILGHSEEEFFLPDNISAEYKLKSSLARSGLEHLAAGWCDPTWYNSVLTLELSNMTQHHQLGIKEGMKVGQMVFFQHDPVPSQASYYMRGKYNNDKTVSKSKGVT